MKPHEMNYDLLFSRSNLSDKQIEPLLNEVHKKNTYNKITNFIDHFIEKSSEAEPAIQDFPITEIPPSGIIISKSGTYTLANDIKWKPEEYGAAIYICSDNVTLNFNKNTLKMDSDDKELEAVGVFIFPEDDILINDISIKSGTIANSSLSGILSYKTCKLTISDFIIQDEGNQLQFIPELPTAGIQAILNEKICIDNCRIKNLNKTAFALSGIEILFSNDIKLSETEISQLTNFDGVTAGYNIFGCSDITAKDCTAKGLRTHYCNEIDTLGHTCIGHLFTMCLNGNISDCKSEDIKGCCDDTHGMSIFISSIFKVKNFEANGILDGDCACMTGAKATGLEIYGFDISIKNSKVKNIKAIRPQNLQSAGYSCWGSFIRIENCTAKNVSVLNKDLEPDTFYGFGTGFGWAPDPRINYRNTDASEVSYINCSAEKCQVGFDTWKHTNSIWQQSFTRECEIPKLIEPEGMIRTFTMDFCSESPTGMPFSAEIINTATNNQFDSFSAGASYPPMRPENSWSLPRISLPGIYSIQPEFASEWWYYAGWGKSSDGTYLSLQIQLLRSGNNPESDISGYFLGIGWPETPQKENQKYLFAQGYGFGASKDLTDLKAKASLNIPDVTDYSFNASFKPWFEIVRYEDKTDSIKISTADSPTYYFSYQKNKENIPLGCKGSKYYLKGKGSGVCSELKNGQNEIHTENIKYSFNVNLEDQRGFVMEGLSGYVGSEMFPPKKEKSATSFSSSYECAQPQLKITDGSITIAGKEFKIVEGNLWMDRQMIAKSNPEPILPKVNESLLNHINSSNFSTKALYRGNWIGITLKDQHNSSENSKSIDLAVFWDEYKKQWIVGSKVGRFPINGFGNVFFDDDKEACNGGVYLFPKLEGSGSEDWDFDINILDPKNYANSPHWTSSLSNNTYATALNISFSSRAQKNYKIPSEMYLYAIVDNCENRLPYSINSFFEGAAVIYSQPLEKNKETDNQILGYAFIEEMGYN